MSMDSTTRQRELIARVYEAAANEALWPQLGGEIASAFGCSSATVQLRGAESGTRVLTYTSSIRVMDYEAYYGQIDPWVIAASRLGLDRVFVSDELVDDATFVKSEFYADWAVKCEQHYIVGALLNVAPDLIAGIGIHRPRQQGDFSEADRRQVTEFIVHLQRSLRLRARLEETARQRDWSLEALAMADASFCVLDADCHAIYMSPQAARHVGPGRGLCVCGGRIVPSGESQQRRFMAMVRAAAACLVRAGATMGPDSMTITRAAASPLTLAVAPLPAPGDGRPRVLVFFKDTADAQVQPQRLRELFGLTPAEASVADGLLRGRDAQGIAAELGLSWNTVRTHLRHILAKTGTSRQAEFVSLALRSVAVSRAR
jgi:DNA-binding CsgD family transcriptional regulator